MLKTLNDNDQKSYTSPLLSEIEAGELAFKLGYQTKFSSLPQRISHKLAEKSALSLYPIKLERPLVTFTFDDIAKSAAVYGAADLENYNTKGTFYITSSFFGRDIGGSLKANKDDLERLIESGHEIGLHSHSHMPVFTQTIPQFIDDLNDNISILKEVCKGNFTHNYCYPYGVAQLKHKKALQGKVRSARCLSHQINYDKFDPLFLKGQLLDNEHMPLTLLTQLFETAKNKRGWLVLISHQITDKPQALATTRQQLNQALELSQSLGFDIVTIEEGLNRLHVPHIKP